jgi:hypothetical protein
MYRFTSRALFVLCSSAVMAACGGESTPTLPTPSSGSPPTITEVFSGDINRNGGVTHTFLAEASGNIVATLDGLEPEAVSSIGVSLGTWNGSACQVVIANDNAVAGATIVGAASVASNLCLRVYDTGTIATLASYQVTVVHP